MLSNIDIHLSIGAPISRVWRLLTHPASMHRWMVDDGAEMDIISNWKTGSPIVFRGNLHGLSYETKGTILRLEPKAVLEYNYWSSLSQQADVPENYSVITFQLAASEGDTLLTFNHRDIPEGTIYQHFRFYWRGALGGLKNMAEN